MADLNNITFACEVPVRLAEFWAAAFGYEHPDVPAELQKAVDEGIAAGKLKTEDRQAEVERLFALDAAVVETKSHSIGPFEEIWTVMKDPEGNGFCVA